MILDQIDRADGKSVRVDLIMDTNTNTRGGLSLVDLFARWWNCS